MIRIARTLVVACLLALAACGTIPQRNPVGATATEALWAQRRNQLAAIAAFSLQGRIAGGGVLGGSGDLNWQQTGDRSQVLFSGALGVGAIRIEGSPDDFSIRTRDGEYRADEARALLRERLGGELPLADLRYWILGMPRPGDAAALALDEAGRLSRLDQDGWHLDYLDYRSWAGEPGIDLPHKLTLKRGDSKWRVVIDVWSGIS